MRGESLKQSESACLKHFPKSLLAFNPADL